MHISIYENYGKMAQNQRGQFGVSNLRSYSSFSSDSFISYGGTY